MGFDLLASDKRADLDEQCFHNMIYQGSAWYWLRFCFDVILMSGLNFDVK